MKNFIRSLYNTICAAQTAKAEYLMARRLWEVEFRGESFDFVLDAIRNKSYPTQDVRK